MSGDQIVVNRPATDQMFLDDALENLRPARPIPGALGINDSDWTLRADLEAVGLGAINPACAPQA